VNGRAQIGSSQVDEMNLSLTLTMKVKEWRELMRQTDAHKWPSWQFGNAISEMLGHVVNSTDATFEWKD